MNLRFLLNDQSDRFRPMRQWARNKLNENPDGVAELAPSSVRELAAFAGVGTRSWRSTWRGFYRTNESWTWSAPRSITSGISDFRLTTAAAGYPAAANDDRHTHASCDDAWLSPTAGRLDELPATIVTPFPLRLVPA